MEIVINVSLRGAPLKRAIIIDDIIIRDVYAKMPDEVEKEIAKQLPEVVEQCFEEMP